MGVDPAFLFYDGDAAKDVSHMNRLERGCYFDIIQAQRKFGRMPEKLIKKILGNDFDQCWDSIKICLTYDEHMFYISWLEDSIKKRQNFVESRRNNRKGGKQTKIEEKEKTYVEHMSNICETYVEHMENEIVIEDKDLNTDVKEEKINDEFADFWERYGKKGNKQRSFSSWKKLTGKQKTEILEKVDDYVRSTPDKQFRKDAERYLNPKNQHWNDEIVIKKNKMFDYSEIRKGSIEREQGKKFNVIGAE